MPEMLQLIPFYIDGRKMALPLSAVQEVIRVAEITIVPGAPDVVIGVLNIRGRIIAVIDLRKRFRMNDREIGLSDCLIIAETKRRTLALRIDNVEPVTDFDFSTFTTSADIVPGVSFVKGVVKTPEGVIVINDLDAFLSLKEEDQLDQSLSKYSADQK